MSHCWLLFWTFGQPSKLSHDSRVGPSFNIFAATQLARDSQLELDDSLLLPVFDELGSISRSPEHVRLARQPQADRAHNRTLSSPIGSDDDVELRSGPKLDRVVRSAIDALMAKKKNQSITTCKRVPWLDCDKVSSARLVQ